MRGNTDDVEGGMIMSYDKFMESIFHLIKKAGIPLNVRFSNNGGNYTAEADGVKFAGNSASLRISARWGSGHTAFFRPEESEVPSNCQA